MSHVSIAASVLEAIGGPMNLSDYSYCSTSLRLVINDMDNIDDNKVKEIDGVITTVKVANQYQVVIGTNAPKIFDEFRALIQVAHMDNKIKAKDSKSIGVILADVFAVIASIFTPILPALAGSGILRGSLILVNQLGWVSETNGTYQVLTITSLAVFYFLPVLLGISTAKRFNIDPFLSALISAILIHPDLIKLIETIQEGGNLSLFGISLAPMVYHSTVVPIILAIWLYSFLYKFLEKHISDNLKMVLIPLISLVVMVPLTLLFIGPLGIYGGEVIASLVNWLVDQSRILTGFVVGGGYSLLVSLGMHWAINPIMINNVSTLGYDYLDPFTFACNFAVIGTLIGVYFKAKDQSLRNFSLTCFITILLSAIIEPALFGILIKKRKLLLSQMIGGAVGGAYMGLMEVVTNSFVFGSVPTLPAFIGETPANFIHAIIGITISVIVSAIAVFIMTSREETLD